MTTDPPALSTAPTLRVDLRRLRAWCDASPERVAALLASSSRQLPALALARVAAPQVVSWICSHVSAGEGRCISFHLSIRSKKRHRMPSQHLRKRSARIISLFLMVRLGCRIGVGFPVKPGLLSNKAPTDLRVNTKNNNALTTNMLARTAALRTFAYYNARVY